MKEDLAITRTKAEHAFLGTEHVIGVGISNKNKEELVFLLERSSPLTERRITTWAQEHGLTVELRVVGGFKPLSKAS